jgi:DNA repair exonuclease SbcCD ATPase subunit
METLINNINGLQIDISDFETLQEVTTAFRAELVKNTILSIQEETNSLLTDFFDGEVNLELTIVENDKLDVIIHKDGNVASFTQLSKGQRQLLRLCFGVSVMKQVSNNSGISFNSLWFDESLDGLSDTMKTKAFHLFESLQTSHDNVYVIDHSEGLKVLFDNQIIVTLNNGNSELA